MRRRPFCETCGAQSKKFINLPEKSVCPNPACKCFGTKQKIAWFCSRVCADIFKAKVQE